MIAGEALVGLLFAGLNLLKIDYVVIQEPKYFFISLLILVLVAVILVRVPLKNAGEKDA